MDIQAFLVEADARIDRANSNEINEFLLELDNIIEEQKDTYVLCNLYYVKANHLAVLKEIRITEDEDRHTLVEIGALETIHEQIIYSFRKSLSLSEEDNRIELEFKEMIITNLANEINHVGRFVEALDLWDSVEKILNRSFPMAIGNMGLGITTYASYLYDQGHRHYLNREAFYRLHYAIDFKEYLHEDAYLYFKNYKEEIEKVYPEEFLKKKEEYVGIQYEKEEGEYRQWCLENKLFLNPLNDVSKSNIADQDILGLPSITLPIEQRYPIFHSYFNQLKQEYVSSRWFLYDSLKREEHFSDSQVGLYNTLDYQMYGLSVQKLRIAFRTVYSIFDKIAYFLNEYYQIGIPKQQISFKSIWYKNLRAKKLEIRDEIKFHRNGPLKGLFWLSKDFYYKGDIDYRDVMEPDAQKLDAIRNHLEHKFLSIHLPFHVDMKQDEKLSMESINDDELYLRALKLLKLSRAALVYLSLSVQIEEQNRKETYKGKFIPLVKLDYVDDAEKF